MQTKTVEGQKKVTWETRYQPVTNETSFDEFVINPVFATIDETWHKVKISVMRRGRTLGPKQKIYRIRWSRIIIVLAEFQSVDTQPRLSLPKDNEHDNPSDEAGPPVS